MKVAQLVRAPDCGSGGRGFESPLSPFSRLNRSFYSYALTDIIKELEFESKDDNDVMRFKIERFFYAVIGGPPV